MDIANDRLVGSFESSGLSGSGVTSWCSTGWTVFATLDTDAIATVFNGSITVFDIGTFSVDWAEFFFDFSGDSGDSIFNLPAWCL
jgi:hypothetical protein